MHSSESECKGECEGLGPCEGAGECDGEVKAKVKVNAKVKVKVEVKVSVDVSHVTRTTIKNVTASTIRSSEAIKSRAKRNIEPSTSELRLLPVFVDACCLWQTVHRRNPPSSRAMAIKSVKSLLM